MTPYAHIGGMTKQIGLLLLTLSLSCGTQTRPPAQAIAGIDDNRDLIVWIQDVKGPGAASGGRLRAFDLKGGRRVRDKIARLLYEGHIQFRREHYATATGLYTEASRLDPGNREIAALVNLANRAYYQKLVDENRRYLIETWLRLTEDTHLLSMPKTQLVRYADEQAWRQTESTWRMVDQSKTWRRSTLMPNTSRLMIGEKSALPMQGMQVQVRLDGFRARVLIDFYFHNPHDKRYEGTFSLRLPDGASPYFLAYGQTTYQATTPQTVSTTGFDEDTIMRDRAASWIRPRRARMVARVTAARAYTETVRRKVDPALLEWGGAGVFRARIFPIEPGRLCRVVVGYDMTLPAVGADLAFSLDLPRRIPSLQVELDLARLPGVEVTVTPAARAVESKRRLRYRFRNPEQRRITVRLHEPGPLLLTDGSYFATAFEPSLPRGARLPGARRAVFLVDRSLSAKPDRYNTWLALLRAMLERNRDTLREFAVLFFDIEATWWQPRFVSNTARNRAQLLRDAAGMTLDGATDLGHALTQAVRPTWLARSADRYALFLLSDGAASWGERDPQTLARILESTRTGPPACSGTGLDRVLLPKSAHAGRWAPERRRDLRLRSGTLRDAQGAARSLSDPAEVLSGRPESQGHRHLGAGDDHP